MKYYILHNHCSKNGDDAKTDMPPAAKSVVREPVVELYSALTLTALESPGRKTAEHSGADNTCFELVLI